MRKYLSLLLLSVSAVAVSAQTSVTGDVAGRVVDVTGAAVPGSTVTLLSKDDGSKKTAITDKSGNYRFALLRPGTYSIHEEGSGMTADATVVPVNVGQTMTVDLTSKPAGNVTTVEVETGQPLIQTEDANISYTFSQKQIETLPIPGGDITNLAFSTPGTQSSTGGGYGNFTTFGLPGNSNVFTVNGSDLMDAYNNLANSGASNNVLGANELSEAAVVVNAYSGQYGRLAGAQVNFTTKTGTNQFHGNASLFYNSSGFNANDWFIKQNQLESGLPNAQPHAVSRQWGGSIGGPIWKDKLFFFFDDEGLRYALPGGGATNYFPTQAFETATLANLATKNPSQVAFYQKVFALYNAAPGYANSIPDTAADEGCGDFSGTTVGGTLFGTGATPCAAALVSNVGNLNTEQLYAARIDINPTSKDQVNFRFRHDWGVQATSTDPVNSLFSANSTQPEYDGQGNWTHTFGPSLTNSLTAASLYYDAIFGPPSFGAAVAAFPAVFAFTDGDGFVNLGGSNNSYPQGRNVSQYQVVDDLSYTRGKHSFKAGLNFRRFNMTAFATTAGTQTPLVTFNSNTDFVNGVIGAGTANTGADTTTGYFAATGPGHMAIYDLGVYFQDQYAATDKLKLTASLRFDRMGNPACNGNCFVRLASQFNEISHDPTIPYNKAIITGQRNAFNDVEPVTIQPRVGFALSPFGSNGRTVIRGGAGLFADIAVPASFVRFISSAPNYTTFTVTGSTASTYEASPGTAGSAYSAAQASYKAFANGFASGQTFATISGNVAAAGSKFTAPSYTAAAPDQLRNPKFIEYNFEVQQALSHRDVIDINYVGNFGVDILFFQPGVNAYAAVAGTLPGLPTAKPDTRFTAVTQMTNFGHSNYNGITSSWRHQMRGLSTAVNYTFGHALDNTSNGGYEGFVYNSTTGAANVLSQIDPLSVDRLNYGSADYDSRHLLTVNYSYQPTFGFKNHLVKEAAAGFSLAGQLTSKSGNPFSVIRSGFTSTYTGSTDGGSVLAAYVGNGAKHSCSNPSSTCLVGSDYSTAAIQAASYGFGNQARNSYRGPGYFDWDVNFAKVTPVTEHANLKIGANFFNILNHPNFQQPGNNVASTGTFGKILADQPPVSSPYGNFQGAGVSGRIIQVYGTVSF